MVFWNSTDRASRWNDRSSKSDWKGPELQRTKRESPPARVRVGLDRSALVGRSRSLDDDDDTHVVVRRRIERARWLCC